MDLRTGEHITALQAQSGVFIWELNNPLYFKIIKHISRPFNRNHDMISVQIRFNHNLRKELGIHKCYLNFQIWTTLRPQTGHFLRVFRTQIIKYLDNLNVISINNIIRAVNHVLYNILDNIVDVSENHEIKFNIY
uniref:Replication enhancer n=1 Tax=Tomato leaf curl Mali virus TaxID=260379 RepID=A0A5C1D495_9GEMI|nr:replication enhancer protein [Tomato leaf curl Mali virus]QEL50487.1 replication enhancer protein [Tomato leaf curl Mali virus]QEL50499.1 replication enhancer protein [Tomato leaf curl Mali virus]QEL50505.1 replication enhancer protein [Tomato leaf curl Mali virus]QEL50511.1 replication enhancer protein [Tomato leaf curl Mali virus]